VAWRDQLQPASFRDAPFFVDTADTAGGRKTVVHEYPFRDEAFAEDLGRRARSFRIDGYVLGPDYFSARDALSAALETKGPGTLIHPYHGRRNVSIVGPFGLRESKDEGGLARFSMEFVETASEAFSPSSAIAAPAAASKSADAALVGVRRSYITHYSTLMPSGRTAPASAFTGAIAALTNWNTQIRKSLSPILKGTQTLAKFHAQLDALTIGASLLVRDPISLMNSLGTIVDGLLTGIQLPRLGVDALLHTYDFPSVVSSAYPTTPTQARGQINTQALDAYVRRITIVGAGRLSVDAAQVEAADGGYDSYEDAVNVRTAIFDRLDVDALTQINTIDSNGVIAPATDDDAFVVLMQLRADLGRAVPGADNDLPRLLTRIPPVTLPALVLAYQLYGSVELEADIVTRNDVRHPGFVPGGQSLQVLSHA
jgi:prophage DNA circulation protein